MDSITMVTPLGNLLL